MRPAALPLTPERSSPWLPIAGLLCLTAVAYTPAFSAGFIWDDDVFVTRNAHLRTAAGLVRIWTDPAATLQYYPLVHTTFWVEYQLWGLHPLGYHAINVLLHGLAAVLLWRVLRRLSLPGAAVAAALFALHPVHVESVAWVTERKNVLSGVFYLASLLAWLSFQPLEPGESPGPRRWRWYALSLVAFLAALLSKTVTCSLPAVMLLLVYWRKGRIERSDWLPLAPYFGLGLLLGGMTVFYERDFVNAVGPPWELSFLERTLIAGRALWFYVGKLLWPHPLTFNYPLWDIDTTAAWQYLFPLACLALLVTLWAGRKRIGRGPLVAALFFGGTLLPALGFVNVYPMRYSYVADHFQYLASLGVLVPLAVLLAGAGRRLRERGHGRLALAGGGVLVVLLATLTFSQARIYRDLPTLWHATLADNPRSTLALANLGAAAIEEGRIDEGIELLERAVAVTGYNPEALTSLGHGYQQQDRRDEAEACFVRALEQRPDEVGALNNLGALRWQQGRRDEAIELHRQALALSPGHPNANRNLGLELLETGRPREAVEHLELALRWNNSDLFCVRWLAIAHERLGEYDGALHYYESILRIEPDDSDAAAGRARCLDRVGAGERPGR